jgi:fatty acid desaturase
MVLMGPRAPRQAAAAGSPAMDLLSLAAVQAAILGLLTLAFDWWVYLALWLAPLATLTALCHLIRSFVEHAITDAESAEHSNRMITIRSNLLERALVAPYNMNYHAEHHLLPAVPAPRLNEVQERLREREHTPPLLNRSSYAAAIRRYARALQR